MGGMGRWIPGASDIHSKQGIDERHAERRDMEDKE